MSELTDLLKKMSLLSASDLFVTEERVPYFRIHGSISSAGGERMPRATLQAFMQSVLRPHQVLQLEQDGDLDIGYADASLGRFRLNFHHKRGGLGLVVRQVPSGQITLESLGLPASVKGLTTLNRGLVLVTGSTGSGKSTTLAAILHHINHSQPRHIVTIEDPIEFVHEDIRSLVTQREIGSDTRTFESALRHVLRESPDVILIGEMRDAETMNVALSASLTGHLVLSSVHTINASQTLQRILSYYPEHLRVQVATDISMALEAIVAQRLVPREDGTGRVLACEMLLMTPPVRKLVREQRFDELEDLMNNSEGMQSFNRALVRLFEAKQISLAIGMAHATNGDEFRMMASGLERGSAAYLAEHEGLGAIGSLDMKQLLQVALHYKASDVHLTVGIPPMLRVNGRLGPLGKERLTNVDIRRMLFSLLSQVQRERFELERELDFAVSLTQQHRFRINAHYQRNTVAVAMRLIPNQLPELETLGLPPVLKELALKPHGLLLVTGPTGSGKSTTLAAMVAQINSTRNCHIITVEDPIEFFHTNKLSTIEQREVGADTHTFAAALKYILRQDPDVILVGEMRDVETIGAALTAAETGHLVLATLHTNDAPQSIDRIIDVFPPHQQPQVRSQLASCLLGVLAQRLLIQKDGKGRVPAFELLLGSSAVRASIRDGKVHQLVSIMETSRKEGMLTIDRCLIELVKGGKVAFEEAIRYARVPNALQEVSASIPVNTLRR